VLRPGLTDANDHPGDHVERGDIEALVVNLVEWAASYARIAGLALVGSHARGASRSDSGVDIVVLTEAPNAFFEDTSWLRRFGATARWRDETWGRVRTLRAWRRDGSELEFNFATPDWARQPLDEETRRVVEDGVRVLFDRTGELRALLQA